MFDGALEYSTDEIDGAGLMGKKNEAIKLTSSLGFLLLVALSRL